MRSCPSTPSTTTRRWTCSWCPAATAPAARYPTPPSPGGSAKPPRPPHGPPASAPGPCSCTRPARPAAAGEQPPTTHSKTPSRHALTSPWSATPATSSTATWSPPRASPPASTWRCDSSAASAAATTRAPPAAISNTTPHRPTSPTSPPASETRRNPADLQITRRPGRQIWIEFGNVSAHPVQLTVFGIANVGQLPLPLAPDQPVLRSSAMEPRDAGVRTDRLFARAREDCRLLSVTGFPISLFPRLAQFGLPTDHAGTAKVSRCARGTRLGPRHDRTFSLRRRRNFTRRLRGDVTADRLEPNDQTRFCRRRMSAYLLPGHNDPRIVP